MIVQKEVKLALGLTMIFLLVAAALFVVDSDQPVVDAGQGDGNVADIPNENSDDITEGNTDIPGENPDLASAGDIPPADIPADELPEPPVEPPVDEYNRDDGSLDIPPAVPDLPDMPDNNDLPDDEYNREDGNVAPPEGDLPDNNLPDLPDAGDLPDTPDIPARFPKAADLTGETVTLGGGEYVVKPKDTMGKIAKEIYGSSSYWPRIQDANSHIPENEMMPGTKLIIPRVKIKTKTAPKPKAGTAEEISPGTMTYVVKKEDTLGGISKRFYGSSGKWKKILDANRSKIKDEYSMRHGITIVIPGVKAAEKKPAFDVDSLPAIETGEPGTIQKTHIVKDGETLWAVAELYFGNGMKYKQIAAANPAINPDNLIVGKRLVIPGLKGVTSSTGEKYFIYSLQDGETLSEVSQKFLGTSTRWKELKALNGIADERKLSAGMQIKVPGAAPASYKPAASSTAQDTSFFPDTSTGTGYLAGGRTVPGGERIYTVKTGDFLGKIAIQFYGSVRYVGKIKEANPAIPANDEIYIGMKLRLPHIEGTAPGSMTPSRSSRSSAPVYEPPVRDSNPSGGSDSYMSPGSRRRRTTAPRKNSGGGSWLENFGS